MKLQMNLTSAYFDVVDGYSSRRNKCNNLDPKSQFVIIIGSVVHMPTPSGPVSIYILYERASETKFEWRFAGGGLCAGFLSLI